MSLSAKPVVNRGGMCCVMSVGGTVFRQTHQQGLERLDSSGRSADKNDPSGWAEKAARRARRLRTAHSHAHLRRGLDLLLQLCRELRQPLGLFMRRLGDEIDGADFKRFQCRLGAALGESRDHHHRHGPERHNLA